MDVFPSYVEALRNGHKRGAADIKTKKEIELIANDAKNYLQSLNEQGGTFTAPDGTVFQKVPYEVLWLVCNGVFIGDVSLRLELNPFLEMIGGHIGYGIRPCFQKQGLGTLILELSKQRAKSKGLKKVLVTCRLDNDASRKIITKNGGVYLDILENPYGFGSRERYWITVM